MPKKLKYLIWSWSLTLILATASFALVLPRPVHAQSNQNLLLADTSNISAKDAFLAAYKNRYTWDQDFPGYKAEVSINHQGELDQGIVRIKPDLSVEVINIDKEEIRELIANQLKMEVIHRRRIPFEQIHGDNSFELEGIDDSGALKIKETGTSDNSYYKVKKQVITQVNRLLGDFAVTVDTLGIAKNPEGYLVTHFQTIFRDASTDQVLERQDVRDFHEKIGSYYLLTARELRSSQQGNPEEKLVADTWVRFNSIQLL